MPKITCSICTGEMVIDEHPGERYVTEANGDIHHLACTAPAPVNESPVTIPDAP